jgi:thiol-disulfide isomerase/thioredoxin
LALAPVGTDLKALELPDTGGARHQLADMAAGKVTVLVYWSLSCPDCQRELPYLSRMYKDYQGKPLALILVNADGSEMAIAAQGYARKLGLPGPYLIDSGPNDTLPFAAAYDLFTTPTSLLFDSQGKLVQVQEIDLDRNKLKTELDRLLVN